MSARRLRVAIVAVSVVLAAAALPWATAPARAGDPATSGGQGAAPTSPSAEDRRFVREAVEGNQLQVVLATFVVDNAASDAARRLSRELLDEHRRADDALLELAARKGISLSDAPDQAPAPNDQEPRTDADPAAPASPADLGPMHAKAYRALATLAGGELDARFASTLVSELQRARGSFERAARDAHDPDIKGYAASTLPSIEDQLRRATELRHAVDGGGQTATPPASGSSSSAPASAAAPPPHAAPDPGAANVMSGGRPASPR